MKLLTFFSWRVQLFAVQDVGFRFKGRVRSNRPRLTQNLTTLNAFAVDTADQGSDIVARLTF